MTADPELTRPVLEALHDDPSEYVRRSVANHLNDHSRIHPEFVVEVARGWSASTHGPRTVAHALRSLVKKGHPGALDLLGFGVVEVGASPIVVDRREVVIGESVTWSTSVENLGTEAVDLVIDYVLFFASAQGGERSKVFKLTRRRLEPEERAELTGTHSFRQLSTRTHVPGPAGLALQVNGIRQARTELVLLAP